MTKILKSKVKSLRDAYFRKLYLNFLPMKKRTKKQKAIFRRLTRRINHIKILSKKVLPGIIKEGVNY